MTDFGADPATHEPGLASRLGHSVSVPNAKWPEWYAALQAIMAGDKPQDWVLYELRAQGLLESCEQHKPCRECGRPRVDFRFDRITCAGRAFMDAAAQGIEAQRAETVKQGSVGDEGPIAESDAPKNPNQSNSPVSGGE